MFPKDACYFVTNAVKFLLVLDYDWSKTLRKILITVLLVILYIKIVMSSAHASVGIVNVMLAELHW